MLLACALPAGARPAEDISETCLACHGDKSTTTTRGGRTVSLYVDGKRFASSVHAAVTCTGCHAKGRTDQQHRDVRGYVYSSPSCYQCHRSGQGGG